MKIKKKFILLIFLLAGGILFFHSCRKDEDDIIDTDPVCDALNVSYSADIVPIVKKYCATTGCHNSMVYPIRGDFNVYSVLKIKVQNGTLRSRVINGSPAQMPPSGPLPSAELKKINCWLLDGAPEN
jgi:hypothetical protein